MKSLCMALLVAFPAIVFAQANYYPGYVVKNNGDTLKGFINYREWAYSPESIAFRTNKNEGQVFDFGPKDVIGFQITGFENYISYIGLVSINKNIFPNIPTALDTTRQPKAIFLKQLATGSHITLYYNNEVSKNRFFIAEKNETPVELKYYEYYGTSRSNEEVKNVFRGQLLLLINKFNNGDEGLANHIESVKFEEQDLTTIVNEINGRGLAAKEIARPGGSKKPKLRLFGGLGLNMIGNTYTYEGVVTNTVNGNTTVVNNIVASHRTNSVAPKFDFGFDLFDNPEVQQFVFRAELAYATLSGQFNQPANANFTEIDLSYTGYKLSFTPQFLYNFYNKPNVKVYIGTGMRLNISSYSNNKSSTTNDPDNFGTGSGVSLQIEAGVVINKRVELSFTYLSYTTNASYSLISVSNQLTKNIGIKIFLN